MGLEKELEAGKYSVHSHADFMAQIEQLNLRRMEIRTELLRAKNEQDILTLVDELERLMVQWHRLFLDTNQELAALAGPQA
jgi:hypothetical protein